MCNARPIVTTFGPRVTEDRLPVTTFCIRVTNFRLPQNGQFAAHLPNSTVALQCTEEKTTDLMLIVTEVTNFVVNREVRHEPFKIIGILFVFLCFSKLLSIAEKAGYFGYRSQFEALEVSNG